jgi:hypothetical protein
MGCHAQGTVRSRKELQLDPEGARSKHIMDAAAAKERPFLIAQSTPGGGRAAGAGGEGQCRGAGGGEGGQPGDELAMGKWASPGGNKGPQLLADEDVTVAPAEDKCPAGSEEEGAGSHWRQA